MDEFAKVTVKTPHLQDAPWTAEILPRDEAGNLYYGVNGTHLYRHRIQLDDLRAAQEDAGVIRTVLDTLPPLEPDAPWEMVAGHNTATDGIRGRLGHIERATIPQIELNLHEEVLQDLLALDRQQPDQPKRTTPISQRIRRFGRRRAAE